MNKEKLDEAIKDLDDMFAYLGEIYADDDITCRAFVRMYHLLIRPTLRPEPIIMVESAKKTEKRHYKRRYKCKIAGEQVDDPIALELRKKYKTPIIAERLNKIMHVLRESKVGMNVDDIKKILPISNWSITVHLMFGQAKGLVVYDGKFWATVVRDRKPDVKVESKSL
jgi:hypothetical protein